ncbi:MAG: NYN domain-containing protein [Actinomycetota bacterium]
MRVGVFIDGQNITIGARHVFGHGNLHPLLLARALAADDELAEVRYATGIPSRDVDPERHDAERRRHDLMLATDVVVMEKPLRYRWEWMIRDRSLPNPYRNQGEVRQARVKSRNRGQEKGVDVWLALDALVMCTRQDLDRVVIASADRDLDLIPDYVRMIPINDGTVVDQAIILDEHRELRQNPAYDRTIRIDREMFEFARDDFDYSRPLDDAEVAALVTRLGSERDGLRD